MSISDDASLREVLAARKADYGHDAPWKASSGKSQGGMKRKAAKESSVSSQAQSDLSRQPLFGRLVPERVHEYQRPSRQPPGPLSAPAPYDTGMIPPTAMPMYGPGGVQSQYFYAPSTAPTLPYGVMPVPPREYYIPPSMPYGPSHAPLPHYYAPTQPAPPRPPQLPPHAVHQHSQPPPKGSSRLPLAPIAPNASAPRTTPATHSKSSESPVPQKRSAPQVRFSATTEVVYLPEEPAPSTNQDRLRQSQERVLKLLLRPASKHEYITTRNLGDWWQAAEQAYEARYKEGRKNFRRSICGGRTASGSRVQGWIPQFRREWLETEEGCILYRNNRRVPFVQKLFLEWIEMEVDRVFFQKACEQEQEAILRADRYAIRSRSTRKRSLLHEDEVSAGDTDVSDDDDDRRYVVTSPDSSTHSQADYSNTDRAPQPASADHILGEQHESRKRGNDCRGSEASVTSVDEDDDGHDSDIAVVGSYRTESTSASNSSDPPAKRKRVH